jgi:hydrogenase nickel incorporation protein HypA/HybF
MHEATLANSIVQAVLHHADKAGATEVKSVTVGLGEWSTFQKEQVRFWVRTAFASTKAAGARVFFRTLPGKIRCRACGTEGRGSSSVEGINPFTGPVLQCPSCGSADVEITQGREAIISKIRVTVGPDPDPRNPRSSAS